MLYKKNGGIIYAYFILLLRIQIPQNGSTISCYIFQALNTTQKNKFQLFKQSKAKHVTVIMRVIFLLSHCIIMYVKTLRYVLTFLMLIKLF